MHTHAAQEARLLSPVPQLDALLAAPADERTTQIQKEDRQ